MATPHTNAPHVTVSQTNKEATINNQADAMDNSFNDVIDLNPGATGGTITAATLRAGFVFRAQFGTASANNWQFAIPTGIKKHFSVVNETGFNCELGFIDAASDVILVEAFSFGIFYTDGITITRLTGGFQGATLEIANEGSIVRQNAFGIDFTGNLVQSVSEVSDGRVEINISSAVDLGGNYPININPRFVGTRKVMPSFTPSGTATYIQPALNAAASDPYGFDDTNRIVVPAGVSKIQLRGLVQPSGTASDNQWGLYKNGSLHPSTDGGVITEVSEDAYTNGGVTWQSGVLDVVPGDTFHIRYYVASTVATWSGWFEVQAIEHQLFDVGVGSIQVTEETGSFLVTDDMFDGFTYKEVNSASPVTVTIPGGLISRGPLVIEQTGAGAVTFDFESGVDLVSFNSLLEIAGQYGVVTVMPKGTDRYTLFGNLA